jgi:hypothetical protein
MPTFSFLRSSRALPSWPGIALLLLSLLVAAPARATSVVPPSFPELVAEADGIFRGRVTAIEARRATAPDGTAIIKTFVTFAIERTLKGTARTELTLDFLGGTVGDESLVVTGMPKFTLGATDYLFVERNGVQFCPLVAVGHGRYRVARDTATARDYLTRDNGTPLTDLAEIQLQMTALPASVRAASAASAVARALTPAAFEASIVAEIQRPTVQAKTR